MLMGAPAGNCCTNPGKSGEVGWEHAIPRGGLTAAARTGARERELERERERERERGHCGRGTLARTMPPKPMPHRHVDSANSSPLANSPFMVGVSGHRDLDTADLPRLREAVTAFVRQLKEHLPDTELRLIVGMAEGADLLVAETALALGVSVEAVLPMPLQHYAADFNGGTFACLQELLRHPNVRCVELTAMAEGSEAKTPLSPAQRDAMYANLTDALIRRSSLLLALWDGEVSRLPGGTADTVLRYLGIRTPEHPGPAALELVDAHEEADVAERLVYWTPTARASAGGVTDLRPPCFLWGTGDSPLQVQHAMPAILRHQLAELNSYNREFQHLSSAGRVACRKHGSRRSTGAPLRAVGIQYTRCSS